jgi:mono/diheme cytochrome c family protein
VNPMVRGRAFVFAVWAASASAASAQDQKQLERGTKVYTDQKCSVCHAIGGRGSAKGALDDVGSRLSAAETRQWIIDPADMTKRTKAERKPVMRAYASLPKDDVDALVAYMLSLKKK